MLVGINHTTAPVEVREKLAFSEAETEAALRELKADSAIEEALLLSTCNRTELIVKRRAISGEGNGGAAPELLTRKLSSWKQTGELPPEVFYIHRDIDAARHIFRVSAGLESMIVGESQILAQTKESYRIACKAGANGYMMNRLMHATFKVGKRARAETEIGIGAVSISLAAVELSQRIFRDLSKKSALVVGAGETAALTAEHFVQKNIGSLTVVNRTYEKAEELARRLGGSAAPLSSLAESIAKSDVVITSTSAPSYLVTPEIMRVAVNIRQKRPIFLIDIGVPRNIDPAVNKIYNVFAHDIDDLNKIVDKNLARRRSETPKVEKIIDEEIALLEEWYRSLEVTPTIKQLVERIESVRREEMKKSSRHFSREQMEKVDALTQSIVNKILHHPISRLRESGDDSDDARFLVETVRNIFNLETPADE